jgi:hypothetical protein
MPNCRIFLKCVLCIWVSLIGLDVHLLYVKWNTSAAGLYADGVNLLGDYMDTIKENTEALIDASKKVSLEANAEKSICCCLVTRMQGKLLHKDS